METVERVNFRLPLGKRSIWPYEECQPAKTAQDVAQLHRLWSAFMTEMQMINKQADFPPLLLSPFQSRHSSLTSFSGESLLGVLITLDLDSSNLLNKMLQNPEWFLTTLIPLM